MVIYKIEKPLHYVLCINLTTMDLIKVMAITVSPLGSEKVFGPYDKLHDYIRVQAVIDKQFGKTMFLDSNVFACKGMRDGEYILHTQHIKYTYDECIKKITAILDPFLPEHKYSGLEKHHLKFKIL
jgi:hypothetical protein